MVVVVCDCACVCENARICERLSPTKPRRFDQVQFSFNYRRWWTCPRFSLCLVSPSRANCASVPRCVASRRVANAADVVVVIIGIVSKRTQQPDGERARARVRVRVSSRECFAEPCGGIADGRASADDSFGFEVNRTGPVRCELATLGARACACVQFLLVRHNCSSVPVFCGNQEKNRRPYNIPRIQHY